MSVCAPAIWSRADANRSRSSTHQVGQLARLDGARDARRAKQAWAASDGLRGDRWSRSSRSSGAAARWRAGGDRRGSTAVASCCSGAGVDTDQSLPNASEPPARGCSRTDTCVRATLSDTNGSVSRSRTPRAAPTAASRWRSRSARRSRGMSAGCANCRWARWWRASRRPFARMAASSTSRRLAHRAVAEGVDVDVGSRRRRQAATNRVEVGEVVHVEAALGGGRPEESRYGIQHRGGEVLEDTVVEELDLVADQPPNAARAPGARSAGRAGRCPRRVPSRASPATRMVSSPDSGRAV